ncbi:MAG: Lin0512 family protein [Pseudomonadota bacterium]
MQRFIIEMGTGTSLHRRDYTEAAARAIEDAIRHSTIPMLVALDIDHREMRVDVTVGVQEPAKVDAEVLKAGLPRGSVKVTVVHGGLDVTNPDSGEVNVVATAAVEAFLPPDLVRTRAK